MIHSKMAVALMVSGGGFSGDSKSGKQQKTSTSVEQQEPIKNDAITFDTFTDNLDKAVGIVADKLKTLFDSS